MRFSSIADFRQRATPDDLRALEKYLLNSKIKSEALPTDVYNFSYSSATQYLRSKGYFPRIRRSRKNPKKDEPASKSNNTPTPRPIVLDDDDKTADWVTRSVALPRATLKRVDSIAEQNWYYSKKIVLAKIIEAGLNYYEG